LKRLTAGILRDSSGRNSSSGPRSYGLERLSWRRNCCLDRLEGLTVFCGCFNSRSLIRDISIVSISHLRLNHSGSLHRRIIGVTRSLSLLISPRLIKNGVSVSKLTIELAASPN
jgi:hypothetical protein